MIWLKQNRYLRPCRQEERLTGISPQKSDMITKVKFNMETIKFVDLASQQDRIKIQVDLAIKKVLGHGQYIHGPEVFELEKRLSDYSGSQHVITCASGTDALLMVLMALGVQKGDAVFTTPFSFFATAEVIMLLGATPVFVDINPESFTLDAEKLKTAIEAVKKNDAAKSPLPETMQSSLQPKAVIPVDLFGLPADYDPINEVARKNNLFVLGDGAQSFGAAYRNEKVFNQCDAYTTSFFPSKPLGCYGDGGAVFTSSDSLAHAVRSISVHGKGNHKYENVRAGLNSRLDTIQAAVLLEKLNVFDQEVKIRNEIARFYSNRLQNCLTVPTVPDGCKSVWAQYSVKSTRRRECLEHLRNHNIPTAIYYPTPLHLQPALSGFKYRHGDFPEAETAAKTIFSLPMHPYLTEEQRNYIIDCLNKFYRG